MSEQDERREQRIANRRRTQRDDAVNTWTIRGALVVALLGAAYVVARLMGWL